jgi:threonine/homoserine/homoserine lactone efflux protein
LRGRGLSDKIAPDHPDDFRMPHLLPDWPLLSAFLIASFVLAVTPGPGVFYIVTRSLLQGRRYGFASVAGVALGNLGNAIGAAIGLAALFAVSSVAFTIVKYAGAAYLVYLGVQALRRPAPAAAPDIARAAPDIAPAAPDIIARAALWPVFRDGFVVALLNPKTAIFFAAFLPQFMNPAASHALQGVVLGALFVAIAAVTDSIYALAAGAVAPLLANRRGIRSAGRYITGAAFIGLGLFTALSGSRSGR